MTTTLVIVSDLHVNSTAGLCTPVVNRESGTYHAHRPQRELWESWLDFCKRAEAAPGKKIAIVNGDLGELDTKRRTYELITPNKAEVMAVIPEVIEPLIKIVDSVYIIRGTPAHTGKGAWLEEAIAHDLTNSAKQGTAASWYHLRAVVEGVRIDIAHHASMGGLPWTQANAANKLAAKTIFQYADQYKQPTPDLVIRSHNHRYADSSSNFHTRAIFTPCWSLSTEYGFRNGHENDLPHIGGMLISCQDGAYTYDGPVMYRPAESKRLWALKI